MDPVSTREITPALKPSPGSDPSVTSEAKQSSQTACSLHGPSSRPCFRACCSLLYYKLFYLALHQAEVVMKLCDAALCVPLYPTDQ